MYFGRKGFILSAISIRSSMKMFLHIRTKKGFVGEFHDMCNLFHAQSSVAQCTLDFFHGGGCDDFAGTFTTCPLACNRKIFGSDVEAFCIETDFSDNRMRVVNQFTETSKEMVGGG